MMSGYIGDRPAFQSRPLHYEVERGEGGWCVAVNGCRTLPLPRRRTAERLARALQAEADGLHRRSGLNR